MDECTGDVRLLASARSQTIYETGRVGKGQARIGSGWNAFNAVF